MIVGDLNVAASQQDVHAKYSWEGMYGPEEKRLLAQLLRGFHDVWRLRHPGVADTFTVWDEKTSARVFNEACFLHRSPLHASCFLKRVSLSKMISGFDPCMPHAVSWMSPFQLELSGSSHTGFFGALRSMLRMPAGCRGCASTMRL